jgi:hypothetical protein
VKCSQALPHAIERAGGKPIMWKTGTPLIKEKMKELSAPLAGEMSGHMFFAEGFYGHDDALYGARACCASSPDSGRRARVLSRRSEVRFRPRKSASIAGRDQVRGRGPRGEHFPRHARRDRRRWRARPVRRRMGPHPRVQHAAVLVTRYEARSQQRLDQIQREMEDWLRSQGVTP